MAKRIAAWFAFLLPLAYVGLILSVTVHEVLGHGMTARLFGGSFSRFHVQLDGGGAAWSSAAGHRLEVLAGGTIAQLLLAALLLGAARFLRHRLLVRGALVVLVLNLVMDAVPYGFWDAVYMGGRGDVSRILRLVAWPPLRVVLLVLLGALYVGAVAWVSRLLLRVVEDDLGPLSVRGASFLAGGMVLGFGIASAGFDWDHLIPGAGQMPTLAGVGLQILVGIWLVRGRRREVDRHPVSASSWAIGITVSWALCAATVLVVGLYLQHGVRF